MEIPDLKKRKKKEINRWIMGNRGEKYYKMSKHKIMEKWEEVEERVRSAAQKIQVERAYFQS